MFLQIILNNEINPRKSLFPSVLIFRCSRLAGKPKTYHSPQQVNTFHRAATSSSEKEMPGAKGEN
ncbi:hypothetical protein DAI22_10g091903 [Oryza sativa Japonica Group]|nr:hypothetical protein DAI22_10g091903 [Oryza sativa Japonica Group]